MGKVQDMLTVLIVPPGYFRYLGNISTFSSDLLLPLGSKDRVRDARMLS